MATSQSHTLGEFIGSFFEEVMKGPFRDFASRNGLYFDSAGSRKARASKKVTWTDVHGSKHDLDFVLEEGGSEDFIGEPVAFIELAWRRYTKHSKNKVQEISGAVDPICEKYKLRSPFKGAILSGQFTEASIQQLKDDDFHVFYIPFEKLIHAFKLLGFDVDYDESTKDSEIRRKYAAVSKSGNRQLIAKVHDEFLKLCKREIDQFLEELSESYNRAIKSICILPLHGRRAVIYDVVKAIDFITEYDRIPADSPLEWIEIVVTYNTGTLIDGRFRTKEEAISFLKSLQKG